ncbi:MAG: NADH-quinone oxidoreductase subunit L [Polyangiales bacterium]
MNGFPYETALLWIVLLPILGAVINGLFGRDADRGLVSGVGIGTVAFSFLLSLAGFVHVLDVAGGGAGDARIVNDVYEWMRLGEYSLKVAFSMDALSGLMAVMVTGIGLLIHVYSASYMEEDPGFARFFAYLNLFTGSMLLLVLAKNLPVMFVGWEGVGLCSYLLIGFWYENASYSQAAKKAFLVNRIGDLGVLLGMFVLAGIAGSFDFDAINAVAGSLPAQPLAPGLGALGLTAATGAALLVFLGCTGKSAQLPLYVWLPDAMAGPTPVSALIHAATMVTAGVYLCARIAPVFQSSPNAMAVVAVVGATTALLAATIAVAQNELKKVLAYSTVSQLGFMFAAVGVAAPIAGMFHVFTHAFFKACLFLGAGSVMHAVGAHGDADFRKLGGLAKKLPITHGTFLVSCLSIAGVPLFAGFFSKDEILAGAATAAFGGEGVDTKLRIAAIYALVVLVLAATLTAFYMFRMYFLTFGGTYRGEGTYDDHPHESPPRMTVPLVVLAAGAVLAGYIGLPHVIQDENVISKWLGPVVTPAAVAAEHASSTPAFVAMALGILAMGVGIFGAYTMYRDASEDALPTMLPAGLYRLLEDKWRVDELYAAVVVRPLRAFAEFLAIIDRALVDFAFTRAPALLTQLTGFVVSRAQNGIVHTYGLVMVLGLGGVLGFYLYPHTHIEAEFREDGTVSLSTPRGLGYRYHWDVDSDGVFEGELDPASYAASHRYEEADRVGIALVVTDASGLGADEIAVSRRPMLLDEAELGPHWESDGDTSSVAPSIVRTDAGLVLRPNGHFVQGGEPAPGSADGDAILIRPGSAITLGRARLAAAPIVRATVEVANVFGNRSRSSVSLVLKQNPPTGGEGGQP